jgi:hypothetical protein
MKPIKTLVILIALTLTACSSGPAPIKVEKDKSKIGSFGLQILVTAISDEVTIKHIILNRGNCKAVGPTNAVIRFGQQIEYYASCDPIEVDVSTNNGTWTFNFD